MADATATGTRAKHALHQLGARTVTLSAAAENTNVIDVTVTLVDMGGQTIAEAQQCLARVVGEPAADYTIAETGAGAEVSVTGHTGLVFTTSAAGVATIAVTDVSGASGESVVLEVYPTGCFMCGSSTVTCTFD